MRTPGVRAPAAVRRATMRLRPAAPRRARALSGARASRAGVKAAARAATVTPAVRAVRVRNGPPADEPAGLTAPGLGQGRRGDVLAGNALAAAPVTGFSRVPEKRRNRPRLLLADPAMRSLYADGEDSARIAVARVRTEAASCPRGPAADRTGRRTVHAGRAVRPVAGRPRDRRPHGGRRGPPASGGRRTRPGPGRLDLAFSCSCIR
ncbi:MmyB family transcriptional regulator [Streptomyces sp. NPDC001500]